jgi:two-component system OmpR family response regulator
MLRIVDWPCEGGKAMTDNELRGFESGRQALAGAFVLVVDDDRDTREELHDYLKSHGMHVETAGDVTGARHRLQLRKFDLVLLDLWLGTENGFDFLRELRRSAEIPCIMMTAQDDIIDKIVGLELGADDYLFKPVNLRELLARMRALLRRAAASAQTPANVGGPKGDLPRVNDSGGWHFDPARRNLSGADGQMVPLTTAECDLLIELVGNEGRPQTRDELSRRVFNRQWRPDDRSLDGVIVNLRRKLEPDPDNPQVIKTIRGKGYVFTGFPSQLIVNT